MQVKVYRTDGSAIVIERLDKVIQEFIDSGCTIISVSHAFHGPDWYSVLVTYLVP